MRRVERLEALLAMLRDRPGITAGELAERLGTSARSVFRDLDVLRDRGHRVDASRGRGGGLRLHPKAPLGGIVLSAEEGLGVLLGLATAEGAGLPMFGRALGPVRGRTVNAFPAADRPRLRRLRSRVLVGPAAPAGVRDSWHPPDPRVMRKLQVGFVQERVVRLQAGANSRSGREYRVEPHVLLVRWPAWYLAAREPGRTTVRTFRLDRIGSVSLDSNTFTPRPREMTRQLGDPDLRGPGR